MSFKLRCPNGHKLRFDAKDVGKKGMCPKCQSRVTLQPPRGVSDTSIMAVLGDAPSDRSVLMRPTEESTALPAPGRTCPRCQTRFSSAFQLCPNCLRYLPPSCREDL
ncbi:MAG TPA: hypothetical protein VHC19_00570 [Pirellulales bacterium]|jgi:hypothetical protein|nr:hypothetical protein [Pirellulales bacterium]